MAGDSGVAKDKEHINRRLTAIKSVSAARFDAPEAPRAPQEKRAEERRTVYRFARLVLPDRAVMNCIIKGYSRRGAKVVIEGSVTLPPRVLMKIDQTGETKRAKVVWQNEMEVGLQFVSVEKAATG